MVNRKNKILLATFTAIIIVFAYFGWGVPEYLSYRKAAEAIGGMPWQDGGTVTLVRPLCILDTPPPPATPITCAVSCPLVSTAVASACPGYVEIDVVGQHGTVFIAAPLGFKYSGGGFFPKAGDQFIAGGTSPSIPWVIGIPGPSASRIIKLVDAFKNLIDWI